MRTVTAPDTAPPTGRPAYAVVRALVRPVWRTVPWWALAVGAGLGLLLAGIPRLLPAPPDAWLCLNLLRDAALAFGLGLAFLLDDPARHTTAVVPTRRPVRIGLRVAFVVPFAVLWWTAALLLIPGRARPPVGAVSLEAAATALLALAAAAVAVRLTQVTEPGITLAAGLLPTALAAALLLPDRWTLVAAASDPRWEGAHVRWAVLLVVAALVGAYSTAEPARRRRPRRRSG